MTVKELIQKLESMGPMAEHLDVIVKHGTSPGSFRNLESAMLLYTVGQTYVALRPTEETD